MNSDCLRCPGHRAPQDDDWQRFVAEWWQASRDKWMAADDLLELAVNHARLTAVIGDGSRRSQQSRLGIALVVRQGKQFGAWRISVERDRHRKCARYRLVPAEIEGTLAPRWRLADLLVVWWRRFGPHWVTVDDLLSLATGEGHVPTDRGYVASGALRCTLGSMLCALRGSRVDGWRIEWRPDHDGTPPRFRVHPHEAHLR